MPGSIVVAVRKAVIAGIDAAINEPKVAVTYGWEGADEKRQREQVYTNRVRAVLEPAALRPGKNFRNERMEFDLIYLVFDPKATPEELDTAAMARIDAIDDYLALHKSNELGITGLNWIYPSAFEMSNQLPQSGSGALTVAQWTLRYDARLT